MTLKRSNLRSRYRSTGPIPAVVEIVYERDEGRCAACGFPVFGERGTDWSVQHRRPRGRGGDPRPESSKPGNLVLLHGSGTTSCHGDVESKRDDARVKGLLLAWNKMPAAEPIWHAVHGRVLLDDQGGWTSFGSS